MEAWVGQWLKEQRDAGVKCLEIKDIQGRPYVYHSTSIYDKQEKKPKKVSTYLGRLDPVKGLIPKGMRDTATPQVPRTVKEYGNSKLLHDQLEELLPALQDGFPTCWEEIIALTITRVKGYVPLKRIRDEWDRLENVWKISPNLDPKNMTKTLKCIGGDRAALQVIFKYLTSMSQQMVYDLSSIFSRSMSINEAEKGYNKDKLHVPQINLALFCGIDTGLPSMIRPLPGSVKDVATLVNSLAEVDLRGKVLVLDRGFIAEDLIPIFQKRHIDFIQPTRRNSDFYSHRIHLTQNFMFKDRLIHGGKKKLDDFFVYLFEDEDLALEEKKTLYTKFESEKIQRSDLNDGIVSAGRILILSTLDRDPKTIYGLYKSRDMIEKHFDTYKTELMADKLYLQDSDSLFGHAFIGFLCLYIYCKILNIIKNAECTNKVSPADVLVKFSKVYHFTYTDTDLFSEVPKQVKTLENRLGLKIFPKSLRS